MGSSSNSSTVLDELRDRVSVKSVEGKQSYGTLQVCSKTLDLMRILTESYWMIYEGPELVQMVREDPLCPYAKVT